MKKLSLLLMVFIFLTSCAETTKFYLKDYHALNAPIEAKSSIGLVFFSGSSIQSPLMGELIKRGYSVKPIDFVEGLVRSGKTNLDNVKASIKIDSQLEEFTDFLRSKEYNRGWFSYEHEVEIKKVFQNLKDNYKIKYILFVSYKSGSTNIAGGAIKSNYDFKLIDVDTMNLAAYENLSFVTPKSLKFKDLKKVVKYVVIPVLEGKAPKDPEIKYKNKKIKMTIIR